MSDCMLVLDMLSKFQVLAAANATVLFLWYA